ncbi:hypothetical protein F5Y17DRAFT_446701 [Xylariaceae sp. FL0594]|nr:hypothetical protein F5Y17DRAFT_446701 [Xylariaceae sp. FL0594]
MALQTLQGKKYISGCRYSVSRSPAATPLWSRIRSPQSGLRRPTHVYLAPRRDLNGYYGSPLSPASNSVGLTILMDNASYPAFTYQDFAFPGMVLDGTPPSHVAQSRVVYNVTVPAVRPAFTSCRLYDASEMDVGARTTSSGGIYFEVVIHPETDCWITHSETLPVDTTAPGPRYFGQKHDETGFGCSTHIWTWGSWTNVSSYNEKAQIESIHALACNDTLQAVETSVEFFADTMAVNSQNPPVTNHANVVNVTSTWALGRCQEAKRRCLGYMLSLNMLRSTKLRNPGHRGIRGLWAFRAVKVENIKGQHTS